MPRKCDRREMAEQKLLLLQYHVAPLPSHPVEDIYQEGSSLPEVLGSSIRVSDSCEDIDHRPWRHLQKNQPVSLDHKES